MPLCAASLRVLVALATAAALILTAPPVARASGAEATDAVALVQRSREDAGRSRLAVCAELAVVAREWSARMAEDYRLRHNPSVGDRIGGWRRWSENVGVGSSVTGVHEALERSDAHRANLLDERVTQVGVGVAAADGRVWVTQVFRAPRGATPCTPAEDQ